MRGGGRKRERGDRESTMLKIGRQISVFRERKARERERVQCQREGEKGISVFRERKETESTVLKRGREIGFSLQREKRDTHRVQCQRKGEKEISDFRKKEKRQTEYSVKERERKRF